MFSLEEVESLRRLTFWFRRSLASLRRCSSNRGRRSISISSPSPSSISLAKSDKRTVPFVSAVVDDSDAARNSTRSSNSSGERLSVPPSRSCSPVSEARPAFSDGSNAPPVRIVAVRSNVGNMWSSAMYTTMPLDNTSRNCDAGGT